MPPGVFRASTTTSESAVVASRATAKPKPELLLVAALSKEPRLGRWSRVSGHGTHNGTLILKLEAKQAGRAAPEDAVLE